MPVKRSAKLRYSITSSAVVSNDCGIVRPSALAGLGIGNISHDCQSVKPGNYLAQQFKSLACGVSAS